MQPQAIPQTKDAIQSVIELYRVQPFQARGDSPGIPKKKCKFKASVSTIGEFKNILKVVDYTGPYSEGKRKAMLHKYLISLQ